MEQTNNFRMNNFQNINNNMNQINNFNDFHNPMLNQYNQINPIMNQMNNYYQGNLMLNQMGNYYQNNPMINQMNTILNQMDELLNQINSMINQMNSYDQSNPMLNLDINFMNEMMKKINKKMNEINEKEKQIIELNKKKIIKEMVQNINLNNLNQNQIELINSIIKFYKENGNEYMNFDHPNQIKNIIYLLSLNYLKLNTSDNILLYFNLENPLYYIIEPKKIIRFINSDYKEYKVKIPLSITKYDLYSIAQNYKCFKNNNKHSNTGNHSNILLIHNNLILNRNVTSIECINNNDVIIIIEPRNFPDDSYYKSLQKRTGEKGISHFVR